MPLLLSSPPPGHPSSKAFRVQVAKVVLLALRSQGSWFCLGGENAAAAGYLCDFLTLRADMPANHLEKVRRKARRGKQQAAKDAEQRKDEEDECERRFRRTGTHAAASSRPADDTEEGGID